MTTSYISYTSTIEYTAPEYMGTLSWFNVAKCARERMRQTVGNQEDWTNNRKTFYLALGKIDIPKLNVFPYEV